MSNSNRQNSIDILKGFGIILMVMGHVGFGEKFAIYCATFFMPLFYVISGYLFHDKRKFGQFLGRKFKTLMIPFYSFAMISLLATVVTKEFSTKFIINVLFFPSKDYMPITGAIWFLMSMFITEILYFLIRKIFRDVAIIISFLLFILMTVLPDMFQIFLPFALQTVGISLLYMNIGTLIKKYHLVEKINIKISVVLVLVHIILSQVNGFVNYRQIIFGNYILYFVISLIAIMGYWGLSKYADQKYGKYFLWMTYIGRNSIVYLVTNQLVIKIVRKFISNVIDANNASTYYLNRLVVFLVSMCVIFLLVNIFNKTRLKVLVGK